MKVLVVVDYQGDFVDGALAVAGANEIADGIQTEIDSGKYDKVFYTFDTHEAEAFGVSEEGGMFPMHCEFGTAGWALKVKPVNQFKTEKPFNLLGIDDEFFFCKDKFDIFEGNKVYADVIEKFRGYEFVLCGVATNYCVFTHAMGLVRRGFKVSILKDCVKEIPGDDVEAKMLEMKVNGVVFK